MISKRDYYRYERSRHVSHLRQLRQAINNPRTAKPSLPTLRRQMRNHQALIEDYDKLITGEQPVT